MSEGQHEFLPFTEFVGFELISQPPILGIKYFLICSSVYYPFPQYPLAVKRALVQKILRVALFFLRLERLKEDGDGLRMLEFHVPCVIG